MRSSQERYAKVLTKDEEYEVAQAFDEWLANQPQETKEIVRLHIFNLRATLAPRRVMFGDQAAKVLVAAVYMEVRKSSAGVTA